MRIFQFLDPGPLIDRELELVAPAVRNVDEVLAACLPSAFASDDAAGRA